MVKKKKYMQWTGQLVINQRVKSLVKKRVYLLLQRDGKPDKLVKVTTMGISLDDETGEKIRVCVCRKNRTFTVRPELLFQAVKSKTNKATITKLQKVGYGKLQTFKE